MDDPVFWAVLQPSIQLASDILKLSFNLPFNDAVRSVRKGQNLWRGARATRSIDPPHIADNPADGQQSSPEQISQWLEERSRLVQISFLAPKIGLSKMGSAVTYPRPELGLITVLINPSLLWALLDSATSRAQRAHCAFALGTRLAHEMQHAVFRMEQFALPQPQQLFNEAYYRPVRGRPPQWVAEFGIAYETLLLGGFCRPGSGSDDVLRQGFMTACEDFPNRLMAHSCGGVNLSDHDNEPFVSNPKPP